MPEAQAAFTDLLKWTGLDPALYGIALMLAVLLSLAQAYIHWANTRVTFAVAVVLGMLGALVKLEQGATVQVLVINSLGLIVAQLLGQGLLVKIPGWPQNNQFVKPPTPEGDPKP